MIIALPALGTGGLDELVHGHFGSAPHFALYDTEARRLNFIENPYAVHDHGHCKPTAALEGHDVSMVICKGLGRGALNNLTALGIRVLMTPGAASIGQAVIAWREGRLKEFGSDELCQTHDH